MNDRAAVKRGYRSAQRQEQARTTRLLIVQAAARLFVEQGYGATSVDQIAALAGVSRATVFASAGGKATLLKTAYDIALVGDDAPIPLPARPRSRAIQAEPDPRRFLSLYAALVAEIDGRVAAIYEAVRGAASTDPAARTMWDQIQVERRLGAANVVGLVLSKGILRTGIESDAAADVVWVLIDPGLYHLLVHERGWAPARFAAWLAETLHTQLLPSDP